MKRIVPILWRIAALAAFVFFSMLATSNWAYGVTTPATIEHHMMLRKTYAVLAFAVTGFLLERSEVRWLPGVRGAAIGVALLSLGIEVGQEIVDQAGETLSQHGFDVISGGAGGALGALGSRIFRKNGVTKGDVITTIALLLLVVITYPWTYAPNSPLNQMPYNVP